MTDVTRPDYLCRVLVGRDDENLLSVTLQTGPMVEGGQLTTGTSPKGAPLDEIVEAVIAVLGALVELNHATRSYERIRIMAGVSRSQADDPELMAAASTIATAIKLSDNFELDPDHELAVLH
ncbi:MAG: hypothetical protein MUD05_07745 [Candidatus Nanopelagicales bacterium]|jgi:hypothetical protein|nr:hypothetical protein [Candidatus Nanopelagicales bacterium]